jgi:molecular chaperone HtpG
MVEEKGNISVEAQNIFPIIKKWLYSDKDIFIRELISNACDAINKFKGLVSIGEAKIDGDPKYSIEVVLDKKQKTIAIVDNGIGMTADEVKKYINQVAFSGAEDFLKRYGEKKDEENQIIGHFGLGFYSAFMVSERVEIDTLSYIEGSEAVKWVCSGGIDYEIGPSQRTDRGTTVTLYISQEGDEFLDEYKLRETILKYCSFLPISIYLKSKDKEDKGCKEEPINDTQPLWLKKPGDCSREEYIEFYKKVFMDFEDPLFWIHLNVDYPFRLKGILYFPKLKHNFETIEGRIKLFNNQVFVADNIKEVIPEFLMLLKGTIDCPDLPLNVSRSFLQNDGYVLKISNHIIKKVADKLKQLYDIDRESYNKYWDDINPFIKYGCIREEKFYDAVKDIVIYKTINGEYITLKEYRGERKESRADTVFYVDDEKQQAQYINLFKENGLEAVFLTSPIDIHFIQFLEMKETDLKFKRIDADLSDSIKDGEQNKDEKMSEGLKKIFKDSLGREKLKISVEGLKNTDLPAVILLSEQSRRIQEMGRQLGNMGNAFPIEETLVLNKNNDIIKAVAALGGAQDSGEYLKTICQHVYDLAAISHKQLEPDEMGRFIKRSNELLSKLVGIELERNKEKGV